MLTEFIMELSDEELDFVAGGASVNFTFNAKATGLTKADIKGNINSSATTTKTSEASSVDGSFEITTA